MRCSLVLNSAQRLQKQRRTKHTNSRERRASHSSRLRARALRRTRARSASRAGIDTRRRDANTIARGSLHAGAGTRRHGGGDDRRSSSASLAARPSRPRRIGAPGAFSPAAPGGRRAC